MKIVFFSNVLNHHQVALCDELYAHCGSDFKFVEISGLNESRKKMGFTAYQREYKIDAINNKKIASDWAKSADIAIMGAESFEYLKLRIKRGTGITYSYSERWFKQGLKNLLSPVLFRQIWLYITTGRNKPWYMLCASGFLAKDLNKIGLFKNKCFKWGYFPVYSYSSSSKNIPDGVTRILWVGRFLNWKHPELMVTLARMLEAANIDFQITMIGDGPEYPKIKSIVDSTLQNKIMLLGNKANKDVIYEMKNSDILCFTSDKQEGWGVVLGEAMAVGCSPVASSDAGATPFLITDNGNGLIFKSGSAEDLYSKVRYLICNPTERCRIAESAQKTIHKHWTAVAAVNNFIKLSEALIAKQMVPEFFDEPCSLIKQ